MSDRGVPLRDVFIWRQASPVAWLPSNFPGAARSILLILLGSVAGFLLGFFAGGYEIVLQHIPSTAEMLRKSHEQFTKIPYLKPSFAVMAVGFAPFAEEYLFRGLLFRALDREWGGWRAVFGSAAFFAIYHPVLS